jgi:Xaa-Pro aminopeptidase
MKIILVGLMSILFTLNTFAEKPSAIFFKNRRDRLISKLGSNVLIIKSADDQEVNRNEYRQDSYFWYLTGYPNEGAIAVIDPTSKYKFSLFVSEPSFIAQIYGGIPFPFKDIKKEYCADTVIPLNEFSKHLKQLVKEKRDIYSVKENLDFNFDWKGEAIVNNLTTYDAKPIIDEMRIVKDSLEIALTRKAADITCKALQDVYMNCKANMYEYEIEALIEYDFRKAGSAMPAYRSIVASGSNSTILHYDTNVKRMVDGDLLLMDVGAEFSMYAADVTRTIPVNGKFTKEQRTIYELVLKAEEEAIKLMKPGVGNLECHHKTVEVITDGLMKLGLMTDPNSVWQKKIYNLYRVNHWLGLDVHDVGSFGPETSDYRTYMFNQNEKGRPFTPGMISTIEPGIYFRADLLEKIRQFAGNDVPQKEIDDFIKKVKPAYEKYMNIGIRIEDDVLITETGNIILTNGIPKSIEEIERIMKH